MVTGVILFMISGSAADSELYLIPAAGVLLSLILIKIGITLETISPGDHETRRPVDQ